MRRTEAGVALLCARLDDMDARPLTTAQYCELRKRANALRGTERERELAASDLVRLGYTEHEAGRILYLLSREKRLAAYLQEARRVGVALVTRLSAQYPAKLARAMGMRCPPVLFFRGNPSLFQSRCVSLVGSRRLAEENREFAARVGTLAAREGYTLVSGNAAGADRTAQEACLRAGGSVICFVADSLQDVRHPQPGARVLLCSEACYHAEFSAARALSRNHLIHAMGEKTLVAQTDCGRGGTWAGSCDNLRCGYSPLFVFDDGSQGAAALLARGAQPVHCLQSLAGLRPAQMSLF